MKGNPDFRNTNLSECIITNYDLGMSRTASAALSLVAVQLPKGIDRVTPLFDRVTPLFYTVTPPSISPKLRKLPRYLIFSVATIENYVLL